MKKNILAVFIAAACASGMAHAAEFNPQMQYEYGWQGSGNYITAKQMKQVKAQIENGKPANAEGNAAYSKAVCTFKIAEHTFREVNTKGITEHLVKEALQYNQMAKNGQEPGTSSLMQDTPRQFIERWDSLQRFAGNQCAAPVAACAEAALVGAEYEMKENRPRHAKDFLNQFDNMLKDAEQKAAQCSTEPEPASTRQPEQISFSADALFEFDSDRLKAQGKHDLQRFAGQLANNRLRIQSITINGHTDHLGDEIYNMALSERRAQAVSRYLLENNPALASVIRTAAYGETQPVRECTGNKPTAQLKACLSPNRRVTIEVQAVY